MVLLVDFGTASRQLLVRACELACAQCTGNREFTCQSQSATNLGKCLGLAFPGQTQYLKTGALTWQRRSPAYRTHYDAR
jgi:hypothetical protein